VFHGHYGEDVLTAARLGDVRRASAAIDDWIERNPPRVGDAWHPYTVSTRASSWIAALSLEPALITDRARESLWRHLAFVARNVEDDILGNHVIRNARALVLGGVAFDAPSLLERGLGLLARELPEQVLSDGGHYERSPAYHLVVLRDLLEVAAASGHQSLDDPIARMRAFATALARPDGGPALFNDGGLDVAPELELADPPAGLALFPETGYAVVRRGDVWLAFDCGPPSPPFLPAHAHADALSFQLWVGGRPLVIDPGMPTYEPGRERDWFRGTRAHSTIALDGADQFELWGAFRSGPLPEVELIGATESTLAAAVRWRDGTRHLREVELGPDALAIRDRLEGRGRKTIESSLPLAPGVELAARASGATVERETRRCSEHFFETSEAPTLVARTSASLPAELGWTIPLS
jgi:uncharacterized heparinase superfamily protein